MYCIVLYSTFMRKVYTIVASTRSFSVFNLKPLIQLPQLVITRIRFFGFLKYLCLKNVIKKKKKM